MSRHIRMSRQSVEDYLKTIYYLNEKSLSARASDIASKIGVSPPSATAMLKKLEKRDYVVYTPYKGVTLTRNGWSLAERIVRKHQLLERFLTDTLGMSRERAHEQACELEHSLSDEAEKALESLIIQIHAPTRRGNSRSFKEGLELPRV